jgi:hypothetical protein
MQLSISVEEFNRRLRALARGGVGPGLPRRVADAHILLESVALTLPDAPIYTEKELGEALREWLAAAGPRVDIDPVSLRRYLVDAGYLVRDPAGRAYRVERRPPRGPAFDADVDALEPLALLAACRERPAPGPGVRMGSGPAAGSNPRR